MKTFILISSLILISRLLSFGQADNWTPIVDNGFGFTSQNMVPEMEVFEGYLYASTSPSGPGLAKLYRSPSGDAGTWLDVTPPLAGDKSIHSFGTTSLGGGYIYCGTGSPANGAMIFQSQNGTTWIPIAKRGMGNPLLPTAAPNMVVFQGSGDTIPYLYAGVGSHGGGVPGQVWRIPYNSTDSLDWVKLIDFDTVATIINDTVDLISYFCLWNNKVYFGTNGKGQLWESTNGIDFTQNDSVGYGFGVNTNIVLSSLLVFNDTMYVTTTNIMAGGQLWRTGDGNNWQQITANAFGKADSVNELRSIRTSFGKIWLTGYTEISLSTGTPIWRSDDGVNFIQSNIDGFGDINNNGANAVTIGFGDYQYFGGPNYIDGGQIWRANMMSTTEINETEIIDCSARLFPNPVLDFAVIEINQECEEIKYCNIYDVSGKFIKTISPDSEGHIKIEKNTLSKGMYFYGLQAKQEMIMNGKFIIE